MYDFDSDSPTEMAEDEHGTALENAGLDPDGIHLLNLLIFRLKELMVRVVINLLNCCWWGN